MEKTRLAREKISGFSKLLILFSQGLKGAKIGTTDDFLA
jgi:hypothetical protein